MRLKRRGKRKPQIAKKPSGLVLPEDRLMHQQMRHKRRQKRIPGPVATETGSYHINDVEDRIMRGMKTLRSLPDPERRFFFVKSSYPPFVQEHMDAYAAVEAQAPRFRPTPSDVSGYLTALSWVRHLSRNKWQLLWWRSFEMSFGMMAQRIGQSDETARRHYREALTDAWAAANGLLEAA